MELISVYAYNENGFVIFICILQDVQEYYKVILEQKTSPWVLFSVFLEVQNEISLQQKTVIESPDQFSIRWYAKLNIKKLCRSLPVAWYCLTNTHTIWKWLQEENYCNTHIFTWNFVGRISLPSLCVWGGDGGGRNV